MRKIVVAAVVAWVGAGSGRAANVEPLLVDGFDSGSTCLWSSAVPDHLAVEISAFGEVVAGSTTGAGNVLLASCTGAGRERIYRIVNLAALETLHLLLDPASADLGVYVSQGCPAVSGSNQLGCEDENAAGENERLSFVVSSIAPPLYVTVDGFTAGDAGAFQLTVTTPLCGDAIREGDEECDAVDFDGLTCADFPATPNGTLQCTNGCLIDSSNCLP